MNAQLTPEEFTFLKKCLQAFEAVGQTVLLDKTYNLGPAIGFFGVRQSQICEKVERIQKLRERLEAME